MARISSKCLIAESMRPRLTGSREIEQLRKSLGGVERNSRESPDLTVSLTQLSDVRSSQRSANSASLPPIGA